MKIVHVLAAETMRQKTILFSWRQKSSGGEGHYYTYLAFVGEREPLVKKKRLIYSYQPVAHKVSYDEESPDWISSLNLEDDMIRT